MATIEQAEFYKPCVSSSSGIRTGRTDHREWAHAPALISSAPVSSGRGGEDKYDYATTVTYCWSTNLSPPVADEGVVRLGAGWGGWLGTAINSTRVR